MTSYDMLKLTERSRIQEMLGTFPMLQIQKIVDQQSNIDAIVGRSDLQQIQNVVDVYESMRHVFERHQSWLNKLQSSTEKFVKQMSSPASVAALLQAEVVRQDPMRTAAPLRLMYDQIQKNSIFVRSTLAEYDTAAHHIRDLVAKWQTPEWLSLDELTKVLDGNELADRLAQVEETIALAPEITVGAQREAVPIGATTANKLTPMDWVIVATAVMQLLALMLQLLSTLDSAYTNYLTRQNMGTDQQQVELGRLRQQVEAQLEAVLKRLPESPPPLYVVGNRPTPVRSTLQHGLRIGTAHPNQVVLITGKTGRWVKIRFHDHLENREVEGWVLKHYLIRMPLDPMHP